MSTKLGQKKRIALQLERDPNDQWAEVELYRWQHGELPPQTVDACKPFIPSEGLKNMAKALQDPDHTKWPDRFNVISVLRYAATHLGQPASNH